MIDPKPDQKKDARDRALEAGEIPLDPYPGYLTWFFRASVDQAYRGSELGALCERHRDRESEILDTWCALAQTDPWAWDEARRMLKDLVARGNDVPMPLAKFAIVARPDAKTGPHPEHGRAIRLELFARMMEEEGFERHEVNRQFEKSFPSPGRKDPGSTLRRSRRNARPFVAAVFDTAGSSGPPSEEPRRQTVLEYDWAEPADAARVLLTSGWPALALVWELWHEHHEKRLTDWCDRAKDESWLWDEVWGLLDHFVFCRWDRPLALRGFAACARPADPAGPRRKEALRVKLAAVAQQIEEHGQSQRDARRYCIKALGESESVLDTSTHSRRFNLGRERLEELISLAIR